MIELTPNHYKLIIRDVSDGKGEAFEIFTPAFNAHHFGDTINEALKNYYSYFESEKTRRQKKRIKMPKADINPEKIKQVPLRLKENTYEGVTHRAKSMGMSFNSFVSKQLEEILIN